MQGDFSDQGVDIRTVEPFGRNAPFTHLIHTPLYRLEFGDEFIHDRKARSQLILRYVLVFVSERHIPEVADELPSAKCPHSLGFTVEMRPYVRCSFLEYALRLNRISNPCGPRQNDIEAVILCCQCIYSGSFRLEACDDVVGR